MYTQDKSHRITLRVNENQFEFIKHSADMLGVSPSDFLRMVVNLSMSSTQIASDSVKKVDEEKIKEVIRRENEETNINN